MYPPLLPSQYPYQISNSIDLRSGIHDVDLLGVLVGLQDSGDVAFIIPAPLGGWRSSHQRLAAPGNGGMGHWVQPGQNLCNMYIYDEQHYGVWGIYFYKV